VPEGFHVVHANIVRLRADAGYPVMAGPTGCPDLQDALAEASFEASTSRERFEVPA
jgi:hypothetical protein